MKKCPHCGRDFEKDDYNLCPYCGRVLPLKVSLKERLTQDPALHFALAMLLSGVAVLGILVWLAR